jgi:hypothetical protein
MTRAAPPIHVKTMITECNPFLMETSGFDCIGKPLLSPPEEWPFSGHPSDATTRLKRIKKG